MKRKKKTGRRFYATARPGQGHSMMNRLLLEAAAIGSVQALEDYPLSETPAAQEMLARLALFAMTVSLPAHDSALFVRAFCMAYQARIEDYRRDAEAYRRDRAALRKVGAYALIRAFVAGPQSKVS